MKKLLFILAFLSLLSGCLNTPELKDRILVQMIGIDYDPTFSTYKVTLQVFVPEGGGGKTSIDSSKQNVKYIENEGTNLFQAINSATLQEGKFLFYGDNRAVIIGESAAKQSLPQIMSYLNNDHEARSNMKILVAKGEASKIIKTPLGQGIIPAQGVTEMVKNGIVLGSVYSTSLLTVGQAYYSSTITPVIPVIMMSEKSITETKKNETPTKEGTGQNNESDDKTDSSEAQSSSIQPISQYKLEGSAVFKDKKMIGFINEEQTRGLLFMTKKIKKSIYPAHTPKVDYSTVLLYKSKVNLDMSHKTDDIVMTVNIKSMAILKEILLNSNYESLKDEDLSELEDNIAKQIENDCRSVVSKAIDEYGVDIFYFGDIIWKSDPELWKKIMNEKIDYLQQIQVNYNIDVNINRAGLEQFLE